MSDFFFLFVFEENKRPIEYDKNENVKHSELEHRTERSTIPPINVGSHFTWDGFKMTKRTDEKKNFFFATQTESVTNREERKKRKCCNIIKAILVTTFTN